MAMVGGIADAAPGVVVRAPDRSGPPVMAWSDPAGPAACRPPSSRATAASSRAAIAASARARAAAGMACRAATSAARSAARDAASGPWCHAKLDRPDAP